MTFSHYAIICSWAIGWTVIGGWLLDLIGKLGLNWVFKKSCRLLSPKKKEVKMESEYLSLYDAAFLFDKEGRKKIERRDWEYYIANTEHFVLDMFDDMMESLEVGERKSEVGDDQVTILIHRLLKGGRDNEVSVYGTLTKNSEELLLIQGHQLITFNDKFSILYKDKEKTSVFFYNICVKRKELLGWVERILNNLSLKEREGKNEFNQ